MALGGGDLGRLIVTIATDLTALQTGLQKAQDQVKQAEKIVGGATSNITGKLVELGVKAATFFTTAAIVASRYGVEIEKLSAQSGIATDDLQRLSFAAKLNQSSIEELSIGLRTLANRMADASKGTGEAFDAFRQLGIQATDVDGRLRPTQEVLLDVADVFNRLPDGAQKSATAVSLFGRSGTNLIPFLNQGRSGLRELGDEAERLGIVLDERSIKKAAEFNDTMDKLRAAIQGLINAIGIQAIPILRTLAEAITEISAAMTKAIQSTSEFVAGLGEIAKEAGVAGLVTRESLMAAFEGLTSFMSPIIDPFLEGVGAGIEGIREIGRVAIEANSAFEGAVGTVNLGLQEAQPAIDQFTKSWEDLSTKVNQVGATFGTTLNFALNLALTTGKAIQTHLSSAISNVILGTMSAKEAFAEFGRVLLKALVDFAVQYVITAILVKGLATVAVAFAKGLAAALASAWAPAAALASLATVGSNSVAAIAGISATGIAAKGLAATAALAEGGIVTKPTIALMGEAGPEAVIPLNKASSGFQFGDINIGISFNGPRVGREEAEEIARMIGELTEDQIKRIEV